MITEIRKSIDIEEGKLPLLPLSHFRTIGPRVTQQDRYCLFQTKALLSAEDMKDLFKSMAEATKDFTGGTTANLAGVSARRIIAGNVGDSMTTLFTRAAGKPLNGKRLNKLHTFRPPDEIDRILKLETATLFAAGDHITNLTHRVSMTRRLGNDEFSPMVTSTPSIHDYTFDPGNCEFAQLCLYTDGITDVSGHKHDDLAFEVQHLASLLEQDMDQNPKWHQN